MQCLSCIFCRLFYKSCLTPAGGLYDLVGFRWSTLFLVSCNGLLAVLSSVQLLASRRRSRHRAQYQEILGQDGEWNLKTHTRSISIRTITSWIESLTFSTSPSFINERVEIKVNQNFLWYCPTRSVLVLFSWRVCSNPLESVAIAAFRRPTR